MHNPFLHRPEVSEPKFLRLSSGHLSALTRDWLAQRSVSLGYTEPTKGPCLGASTSLGWWVATLTSADSLAKAPEDLRICIVLARKANLTHLLFETGAETIKGLPTFTS